MVINMNEFNGRNIKRALNVKVARFSYHNKNKSGGNFGLYVNINGNPLEYHGYYNTSGVIYELTFSPIWGVGGTILSRKFPGWEEITFSDAMKRSLELYKMYLDTGAFNR